MGNKVKGLAECSKYTMNPIEYLECRAKQRNRYRQTSDNNRIGRINAELKKLYGITYAEYESIFAQQNGLCAICNKPNVKRLHVDHDHNTGMIRGLLCGQCNVMLGMAHDDITVLVAAIEYLAK